MEGLLVLAAAEIIAVSSLKRLQEKKRHEILRKWKEGTLTMPELLALKRSLWFQKLFAKIPLSDKLEKIH